MIERVLVFIARYLNTSEGYIKTKKFFYNLFENEKYKYKRFFDIFMIFIVLSSVFVLLYDVKNQLGKILYIYDIYIVTTIFVIEYFIRLWIYNDSRKIILDELEESTFLGRPFNTKKVLYEIFRKKIEYITSPFAIIDLLAILPAYRPLRILRIFMLFRLFKVLRYTKSVNHFLSIIQTKKFELLTLLLLIAFITFIGGAVIYVFEYKVNPNIKSFFDAFYWSLITISTVGYGDISPVTDQGRVLTMFLILSGIAFISFTTSIIASAFTEKLQEMKINRIENEARKLKEFYLICGYSKLTELVVTKLKANNEKFIVIDSNDEHIEKAVNDGFLALKEDITKNEVLELFNFKNVKDILILTEDDIINTFLTLSLHSYSPTTRIISVANNQINEDKIKKAGANFILNPTETTALFIREYIGSPVSFEIITDIFSEDGQNGVDEIEVLEDSFLENRLIGDFDFKKYQLILLGVVKSREDRINKNIVNFKNKFFYFNPNAQLLLEKGDVILVIGDYRSINYFKYKLQKSEL